MKVNRRLERDFWTRMKQELRRRKDARRAEQVREAAFPSPIPPRRVYRDLHEVEMQMLSSDSM